jgi:hypothetical protein
MRRGLQKIDSVAPIFRGCTWTALVEKVVNKTCADKTFWSTVEAQDKTNCFSGCSGGFNTTDPCYVRCLYKTILGPDAATPGGQVSGMPLEGLVSAWDAAFATSDPSKGGCPPIAYK